MAFIRTIRLCRRWNSGQFEIFCSCRILPYGAIPRLYCSKLLKLNQCVVIPSFIGLFSVSGHCN
jgi:hypothetical protein